MDAMHQVGVISIVPAEYPCSPPYHPETVYPEFLGLGGLVSDSAPNRVFAGVRELFHALGLDRVRSETEHWNPLGEFISPGSKVVIKPNLVLHESARLVGTQCLTTHGSVIRALVDYAY